MQVIDNKAIAWWNEGRNILTKMLHSISMPQVSLSISIVAQILEQLDLLFPSWRWERLWRDIEPRRYGRKIHPQDLVEVFLMALLESLGLPLPNRPKRIANVLVKIA